MIELGIQIIAQSARIKVEMNIYKTNWNWSARSVHKNPSIPIILQEIKNCLFTILGMKKYEIKTRYAYLSFISRFVK